MNAITDQIIAEAWRRAFALGFKPWNAEHAAGRITRPLRGNLIPYRGINILMLWAEAMEKGFAAPIWMTFKQALELDAHVRKGERGKPCRLCLIPDPHRNRRRYRRGQRTRYSFPQSLHRFQRRADRRTCPRNTTRRRKRGLRSMQRIERAEAFFAATRADLRHGGNRACYSVTP